jgi:cytochrome b561
MTPDPVLPRYDSVARGLHWGSALLIAIAFVMGLMVDVPPKEWRPAFLNVHVLIGLALVALAVARLLWRAKHPAPPAADAGSPLLARAIQAGHVALYAAMFVVPLIGFAPLFARGRGINFFLFQIPSPIERTKEWIGPTTEIHEIAAYALVALAVGHVAAALWHHFGLHDGLLLRMMPERKGR